MQGKSDHLLLICSTCQGREHAFGLRDALASRLPPCFAIRTVDCMAGCARPTTVGFQSVGKAQYLFGDITSSADIEALLSFAGQYANSVDGWTKATDRPEALFDKTLARMPKIQVEVPA